MQPGKGFLVWLAGLSVLGFLATDMYLPAFAAIQADLQTPAAAVSASLSLFLAGFAVAQLLWGPLSDRYGRKPILLLGLSIFALGSLGMLWVESAAALLTLRFVQAVGVCAATVIWQALVTDYYPSQKIKPYLRHDHATGGIIPGACALTGKLDTDAFLMAGDFRHPVRDYVVADVAGAALKTIGKSAYRRTG